MRAYFFILFFSSFLLLANSPIGKWQNKQQNMVIQFNSNGTFSWSMNNNTINGNWKQLNNQLLQTTTNGQIANYGFLVKGDNLGLVAQNGAQLYFVKVKTQNQIQTKITITPVGKWQNQQQKMVIEFNGNGTFSWSMNSNVINGKWKQINNQLIQTTTNGQIANYGFLVKDNKLGLVAQNGAQLYFDKVINRSNKVNYSLKGKVRGRWYSSDGRVIYKFNFKKNGKYSVAVAKNILNGTWSAKNNVLTITLSGKTTKYSYAFSKGYLILAQSKTAYIVLGKSKKIFKDMLAKVQKKTPVMNNSKAGILTDKQFLYLLRNYAKMNPNTVYNYLTRFSKNQKTWIPIYQAWWSMMVFRACQGDAAYQNVTDRQMCAKAKQDYATQLQFQRDNPSFKTTPFSYGQSQNEKLIFLFRKKAGEVSQADWNLFMNGQKAINNATNNVTKTIVDGFKPIPCTEYYEQGTNVYLGCW